MTEEEKVLQEMEAQLTEAVIEELKKPIDINTLSNNIIICNGNRKDDTELEPMRIITDKGGRKSFDQEQLNKVMEYSKYSNEHEIDEENIEMIEMSEGFYKVDQTWTDEKEKKWRETNELQNNCLYEQTFKNEIEYNKSPKMAKMAREIAEIRKCYPNIRDAAEELSILAAEKRKEKKGK